jgi:hypothetical protein
MEVRRKRKGTWLPYAAGALGALGVGAYGLSRGLLNDQEKATLQKYVDLAERTQNDPTADPFQVGKDYYTHAADLLQNVKPFGVSAKDAIIGLRSNPATPKQFKMHPSSKLHYEQTSISPLHGNTHILTEYTDLVSGKAQPENAQGLYDKSSMEAFIDAVHGAANPTSETVKVDAGQGRGQTRAVTTDTTYKLPTWAVPGGDRFADPAQQALFVANINKRVADVARMPGRAPTRADYANFSDRLTGARDAWLAANNLTADDLRKLPIEQQTGLIDQFNTHLSKTDPDLLKQKAVADLAVGTNKVMWSKFYPDVVYKPALRGAQTANYAAAGLGVGAAGLLAAYLYMNREKRKKQQESVELEPALA